MIRPNSKARNSHFTTQNTLFALLALSACGGPSSSDQATTTGSADISMHALGALNLSTVVATVSGPALPAPKTLNLSARGSSGTWGGLIGALPVGSNYTFHVSAFDSSNTVQYTGDASPIAILKDQVTTVIITAQQAAASVPFKNAVPIIDSLVLSSTSVVPGATITAKATAHDPDAGDTIAFAWSAAPGPDGFSAPTAATTGWTAPAAEGDQTLTLKVTDNHGASTSASVVVHVSASNGRGQADVNVRFNTWPVVTDLVAAPSYIVPGSPTSLTVTASDADGDALSFVWTSSCASAVFSAAAAATAVTLPVGATDTSCDLTVTVSDSKGGSTTGQTTLPVGKPVAVQAPVITDSVQSVSVVDVNGSVNFSVDATDPQGSALTFAWVATAGVLANQINGAGSSQVVWTAPATEKTAFTVSVIVTNALGASAQYDFAVKTAAIVSACTPPASTAWSFGVMSDTQWTGSPDDGRDPNTVSIDIINQLNAKFIAQGVKFVIQVGDLTDNGSNLALQTTALFRQKLYNAGIGFFPFRGNHESSLAGATEFKRVFPQTQTGLMNATPADVFANLIGSVDDTLTMPVAATGGTFTMGSNFSSPSTGTTGLSYAFDYNNIRFVMLDQFVSFDGTASTSGGNYMDPQLPWIGSTLAGKPAGGHALVFGHKGLITENHVDTLFGADPSKDPTGQDTFINALASNGVRYYMGGHDHIHNRSLVTTTDGITAKVMDIIGASDSSKFYIPAIPSNDQKYNVPAFGHGRQTQIVQELNTVGYYIFTVDGAKVSVDFYSAIVNPTLASGEYLISASIPMTFTKRETFGYGLTGQEKVVAESASYVGSLGSFAGTSASILSGTNASTAKDGSTRALSHLVDSAWDAATCATAGSILTLWGTSDLGAANGDTIALSMSFDRSQVSDATLVSGAFGLASQDSTGNWTSAVVQNVGGTPAFVLGAWSASYPLGTFGVDPATNTAWAVVNHAGRFAVARF
jgi:hypothetical protein